MKRLVLILILAVTCLMPIAADENAISVNVDSLTAVELARIEADKEIALASLKAQPSGNEIDKTAVTVISIVFFLPVLVVFVFLGYRAHLRHERRLQNDELILNLARSGQELTPELVNTIRNDENAIKTDTSGTPLPYDKLCTGGALLVAGLVVLLRNRVFGMILFIFGLFITAQGLAIYLSNRNRQ